MTQPADEPRPLPPKLRIFAQLWVAGVLLWFLFVRIYSSNTFQRLREALWNDSP